MLLLLTGSLDSTSDLLVEKVRDKVFRFNYDLFNHYELAFTPDRWTIKNPAGRFISSDCVTSVFWWKSFNYYLPDEDPFIVEEVKYVFRELYNWCRLRGLTKGNPHDFHNRLGKLNLLNIASKHFKTPKSLASFRLAGIGELESDDVVAKSFSSGLTVTNRALLTTQVDKSKLHPDFPWFLQEKIISLSDITVFICGKCLFAYERDRTALKGLDWRAEQSFNPQIKEWHRFALDADDVAAVKGFCKDIDVDWGRIDLMRDEDDLVFLEFNANGQWVFLDYSGKDGLVDAVANYVAGSSNKQTV